MDRDDTAARARPAARARAHRAVRDRRRLRLQARHLGAAAARPRRAEDRPPGAHDLHPPRIDDRRPPSATRRAIAARLGCDAEGRLTALDFDGDLRHRRLCELGPDRRQPRAGARLRPLPRRRTTRAARRAIHTNGPISGAFRGFGVPQAAIAQETLDRPPRRRRRHRPARVPPAERAPRRRRHRHRPAARSGVGIADCLEALAPALDARARRRRGRQRRTRRRAPRRRHRLLLVRLRQHRAAQPLDHPHRPPPRRHASCCTRAPSTSARARTPSSRRSPPTRSACRSPPSRSIGADTALTPDAGKTSASRQTFVSGKAAEAAGRALARRDPAPRQRRPATPALALAGRPCSTVGGARAHRPRRAARRRATATSSPPRRRYDPPTTPLDADGQGMPYAVYGYGAQIAELAVDTRARHRAAHQDHRRPRRRPRDQPDCSPRARSRAASPRASAWR